MNARRGSLAFMPSFGTASAQRLLTVHPDLRLLMETVVARHDCAVLCGRRGKAEQDEAVRTGASRTVWPQSKHNVPCKACAGSGRKPNVPGSVCPICTGTGEQPAGLSMAVDAAPYFGDELPHVNWNTGDKEILKRWHAWGGYVLGTADMLFAAGRITHEVRWGGDWDGDWKHNDQTLHDLPHFELQEP